MIFHYQFFGEYTEDQEPPYRRESFHSQIDSLTPSLRLSIDEALSTLLAYSEEYGSTLIFENAMSTTPCIQTVKGNSSLSRTCAVVVIPDSSL